MFRGLDIAFFFKTSKTKDIIRWFCFGITMMSVWTLSAKHFTTQSTSLSSFTGINVLIYHHPTRCNDDEPLRWFYQTPWSAFSTSRTENKCLWTEPKPVWTGYMSSWTMSQIGWSAFEAQWTKFQASWTPSLDWWTGFKTPWTEHKTAWTTLSTHSQRASTLSQNQSKVFQTASTLAEMQSTISQKQSTIFNKVSTVSEKSSTHPRNASTEAKSQSTFKKQKSIQKYKCITKPKPLIGLQYMSLTAYLDLTSELINPQSALCFYAREPPSLAALPKIE
jgi:hypothetical protein